MLIQREEFRRKLTRRLSLDSDQYINILEKLAESPYRFCGLFRATNFRNKVTQFMSQSREIRFGDFLEEIVKDYFTANGYHYIDHALRYNGYELRPDHLFRTEDTIYFIEQKVRDDHDSTKKRGQVDNYLRKCDCLVHDFPDTDLQCIMWFIDDTMRKNRNYYSTRLHGLTVQGHITHHVFYGAECFDSMDLHCCWEDIVQHLTSWQAEIDSLPSQTPDFDKDKSVLDALLQMPEQKLRKLLTDSVIYRSLRCKLFPTKYNLIQLSHHRDKLSPRTIALLDKAIR